MQLTAFEVQHRLNALAGLPVVQKGFVCNTLLLWFGVDPKSDDAIGMTIDPPWRLVGSEGIVADSDEIPGDGPEFVAATERVDPLIGPVLVEAVICPRTHDLRLSFSDGRVLEKEIFMEEGEEDYEEWNLRLYRQDERYQVRSDSITLDTIDLRR